MNVLWCSWILDGKKSTTGQSTLVPMRLGEAHVVIEEWIYWEFTQPLWQHFSLHTACNTCSGVYSVVCAHTHTLRFSLQLLSHQLRRGGPGTTHNRHLSASCVSHFVQGLLENAIPCSCVHSMNYMSNNFSKLTWVSCNLVDQNALWRMVAFSWFRSLEYHKPFMEEKCILQHHLPVVKVQRWSLGISQ